MTRIPPIVALAAVAVTLGSCGGDEEAATTQPSAPESAGDERDPAPDDAIGDRPGGPSGGGQPDSQQPSPGGDPYSQGAGGEEANLEAAVRSYLSAIDRRDGAALCQLLVGGALATVRLPEQGGGCASSVRASIGHAEPGAPAWRRTRIDSIGPTEIDPDEPGMARVRATVVHLFRGGREPSIEDDLVYLQRTGTAWLIAKPSSSFYRAIGVRDVPLSALVPPR